MCEILGTVSGLLILRSYKTGITTNPRFQNTPEKTEKEGDTVYGRNLSIRSDRISITVNLTSLESMVFLKVLIEENAASVARAESLIFHDPSTIDTTKKSTNKNYTKPGFLKSLLSTTESADLSSNVQVNTDFGTHQEYHGWLVTGTILVFLVVTSLFIWKFKPGKNKMMSTDTSDSTKKGKNLTSVENIERNNSAIQISSEMSHRVVYTSLISSTDQTEDYEEPIHFPLPQSNVYIEILPDLKWTECILYSSPCLETQHWKKYEVRCPENQTIYIRQHNIRDSCQDEGLGCDEKTVNSCSSSLPLNRTITDYQTPFTESVNKCNGKRECILFTEYFERIESKDGALCRNNLNTSIFQRIEYECIPDVHVVDNCVREVDNQTEVHDIYLRFSVKNRNHSCRLIGGLSGIEILHTYNSALRLLFQHIPVYGKLVLFIMKLLQIQKG
ncbi:uncharacterized protein LOC133172121 [Saccostrea echinata]|uniref:uncharacterized protein LOC133172121 n=1 Tax=Saccostrea echinata TaxID=191078 RepID=UPI002A7F4238|nr:uncharacterized protein LOC133172121 [Saccostrea echinata]